MRTLLSQTRRAVHKSTSELGTPFIQDSQLGPNGVCYTERLQCTYMATIFCNSWPGPSVWNVQHHLMSHLRINDVVEAHCYVVNIGQTDSEQIRSRQFCKQLTKVYVAKMSWISCYWFCYVSAHNQFARYHLLIVGFLLKTWIISGQGPKVWVPQIQ